MADRFAEFAKKAADVPPTEDIPIDQKDEKHVTIAVQTSPEPQVSPEEEKMEMPIFFEQVKEVEGNIKKIQVYSEQIEKQHVASLNSTKQEDVELCSQKVRQLMGALTQMSNQTRMILKNMDSRTKELEPAAAKGSGSLRMRQTKHRQIVENFAAVMKKYKKVQEKFDKKYKAQLERQVKLVNPAITKDELARVMEDPESARQSLFDIGKKKAAEKDLKDMTDRFEDVKQIAASLIELQQMFLEMDEMITSQGDVINRIEYNVDNIEGYTEDAKKDLASAVESQKSIMKKKWIMAILFVILIILLLAVIAYVIRTFLPVRRIAKK